MNRYLIGYADKLDGTPFSEFVNLLEISKGRFAIFCEENAEEVKNFLTEHFSRELNIGWNSGSKEKAVILAISPVPKC